MSGQIKEAITTIASASGAEVEGEISRRSMLRIMKEGGVAAGMQVVDDVRSADSKSLHPMYPVKKLNMFFSHNNQQ